MLVHTQNNYFFESESVLLYRDNFTPHGFTNDALLVVIALYFLRAICVLPSTGPCFEKEGLLGL